MSGGVDSSVAALILKKQGYDVIGLFMKNWEEKDDNVQCLAAQDYQDVARVCEKLDIPYYSVEFIKEYRENVFKQFIEEYRQGLTPNPDILCNREIKFKAFYQKAMELGADYLATGHYCQNRVMGLKRALVKGRDGGKDQSYFLYTIKDRILEKVLFPIGGLLKSQVRAMACEYDLSTKNKKDSTGICFIGERNFRKFLANYLNIRPGNFENLKGQVVGRHQGSAFYTIGQRKGLGLGGQGEPWFVVDKDNNRNVVVVERGVRHPAMYSKSLTATDLSWVAGNFLQDLPFKCQAKIRYRQADQECLIAKIDRGILSVEFQIPQRAIAPGQSIVFYRDDVCLGGAVIKKPGPNFYELNGLLPEVVSV